MIAAEAGVSVGTAFRVVNKYPNVDVTLRDRVLLACRNLGFSPRVRLGSIALVVGRKSPALRVGYTSIMTTLLLHELAARHRPAEIYAIDDADQISSTSHVDGVVAVVFDDRVAALKEVPNLPILSINHLIDGIHGLSTDHYKQGVMAAEYLVQCGHRRIGFLAIQPDEWGSRERLRGYLDVLKADPATKDLPGPDPGWVQYTLDKSILDVKDVIARWLDQKVTAILNFSEDTSLEVLHLLTDWFKLRIGQDVSTISLEDLDIYKYLSPAQTTIYQPLEKLAQTAVERIIELCEGKHEDRGDRQVLWECLESRLIERDSVARLSLPR